MKTDPLYTVAEVSDLLRLKPWTIYAAIRRGEFPVVKIGRCIRVRPDELDTYLGAHAVAMRPERES